MMSLYRIITTTFLITLSFEGYGREQAPTLEPLTIMDEAYLDRHRTFIDELGRSEFGTRVRKNINDLKLLKRILDSGLISQVEKTKFHSAGVVLGDIYVSELNLEWRNYTDEYGKTHAVCIPKTDQCLFPVTMISKRGVLGVIPDVEKIYYRGIELIEDELPKLPYAIKKPAPRQSNGRTYPLR